MRAQALPIVVAALAASLLPSAALAAGGSSTGTGSATGSGPATTPVVIPSGTSPFGPPQPLTPPQVPTSTATTPVIVNPALTSNSAGGSLSGADAILIGIGAVLVLAGIAYFIWADSRRHAHLRPGAVAATSAGRSGSKPPPKPRKLSAAERRRRRRGRAR